MWKPSLPQFFTMYLLQQIRHHEGAGNSEERRSQREVHPRARPPLRLVQGPGRAGGCRLLTLSTGAPV